MNNRAKSIEFYKLDWDTDFFGVKCAKAILHEPLKRKEWITLKKQFLNYQFVTIENKDSNPINAQLIGKETKAFLADVNIQFSKKTTNCSLQSDHIEINRNQDYSKEILNLTHFKYSKFVEDPEFAKRNGNDIYRQWVLNSFNKEEKFFAIHRDINNSIDSFLLYSYKSKACTIELISVSSNVLNSGIGTKLVKALEGEAYKYGSVEIKVGTQVRNKGAINFYQKNNFKQTECNQIFHLWMNR